MQLHWAWDAFPITSLDKMWASLLSIAAGDHRNSPHDTDGRPPIDGITQGQAHIPLLYMAQYPDSTENEH